MTKILTSSYKPSTFTIALQGIVSDMGGFFSRFFDTLPESQEMPERLRFDIGQIDIDPDRAGRRSNAGNDLDMMRLRSI